MEIAINSPLPERAKLALLRDPEAVLLLARLLGRLFHLRHERVPEGARRVRRRGRGHHGDRPVRPEVEVLAAGRRRVTRPSTASAGRADVVRVTEMKPSPSSIAVTQSLSVTVISDPVSSLLLVTVTELAANSLR